MKVIGVDPGGKTSGIVVLADGRYVDHELVDRGGMRLHDYLDQVVGVVSAFDYAHVVEVIACEALNEPTAHLGYTKVRPLLDTAEVIGALAHAFSDLLLVAPAGHGKTPDLPPGPHLDAVMAQSYPPQLLGPRELGCAYTGRLRHARSAWDVSKAAARQVAQQRMEV